MEKSFGYSTAPEIWSVPPSNSAFQDGGIVDMSFTGRPLLLLSGTGNAGPYLREHFVPLLAERPERNEKFWASLADQNGDFGIRSHSVEIGPGQEHFRSLCPDGSYPAIVKGIRRPPDNIGVFYQTTHPPRRMKRIGERTNLIKQEYW